jgi:hypothetical protein
MTKGQFKVLGLLTIPESFAVQRYTDFGEPTSRALVHVGKDTAITTYDTLMALETLQAIAMDPRLVGRQDKLYRLTERGAELHAAEVERIKALYLAKRAGR